MEAKERTDYLPKNSQMELGLEPRAHALTASRTGPICFSGDKSAQVKGLSFLSLAIHV